MAATIFVWQKEGNQGSSSVTRNQRLVLVWFEDHCSARGIVRVSSPEIGLIFGWSHQYTQKILKYHIDSGNLEELQKGVGRRPTKYLVTSVSCNQMDLAATKSPSRSSTPKNVAHHVPSGNQNGSFGTSKTVFPKNSLPFRYIKVKDKEQENAQRVAHIRNGTVFDGVASNLKSIRTRSTPFNRFRTQCDKVDKWRAPDFVCYFSYVFRVKFGENPELNWPMELGAARTLLHRLGEPWKLKIFIQSAFLFAKKKPNGLRTFTNDYYFRDIIAQKYTEDELEEYDDICVFPWLYQKARAESIAASREYNARLTRRAFGIYD